MLAIFVYAVSPLFTAMTNSDPIIAGPRTIPGMQLYDGLSMSAGETFRLFPLFIGYWLITSVRDQRMMLTMIVIAGLCYSLILLIEVRLSPQFHKTIYGFHPSGFSSSSRGSGFRPRGFLVNGLVAAFFTLTVVIATLAIWRDDRTRINEGLNKLAIVKPRWFGLAATYMTSILVISRSLGALLFGAFAVCAIVLFKPRTQLLVAVMITTLATTYPILRSLDLVLHEQLVSAAA